MTETDAAPEITTDRKFSAPDFIRVVALALVILLHVSDDYAGVYPAEDLFWTLIGNLVHAPTRISVPLFFMLSGWLLLRKQEESYLDFFRKRLWRVVPPFLFYAGVFYLWRAFYGGEPFTIRKILSDLLNFRLHTHFWFVYAILGLYLLTPILRELVHKGSRKTQAYILLLWLVNMSLLPFLDQILGLEIAAPYVFQIGSFVGYFLLGFMLSEIKLTPWQKGWAWLALAGSVAVAVTATHFLSITRGEFVKHFYLYTSLTTFAGAAAAFLLLRNIPFERWYQKRPGLEKFIGAVGAISYGVYLLHPLMIVILERGVLGFQVSKRLDPPWIGIPALFVFSAVSSTLIVWLLSKIPGLKKLVA